MELEVNGISFSYNSIPALKDVSFQVNGGEALGIIGPNGSGKSTLLKCINKKLVPDHGAVLLSGQDVRSLSRREIAEKFGVVPQVSSISFPFTVFEVVLMGRTPYVDRLRGEKQKDFEAVHRMLKDLDLEHMADRSITRVSGGEYQKVVIARALAQEPDVLLMDEPTLHLDVSHQLELLELVTKLKKENGLTVVMASHDINLAIRYTDRIMMIKEGEIYCIGDPGNTVTEESIREVFGINVIIEEIPVSGITNVVPLSPANTGMNH